MKTQHTGLTPLARYPSYHINKQGSVYSDFSKYFLVSHPNEYGYHRVTLKSPHGGRKTEFIHNLMVETFIGNKDGLQVRHLDGDKSNNALINLKLGTAKENADDREKHGNTQRGEKHAELIQLRKENFKLKKELGSPLYQLAPKLLKAGIKLITAKDKAVEVNKEYVMTGAQITALLELEEAIKQATK